MTSQEEADRMLAAAFGRSSTGATESEDFVRADRAVAAAHGRELQTDVEFRGRLMTAGLSEAGARMLMRDLEDGFEPDRAIEMASRFTAKPNGVPSLVAAEVRPVVEARRKAASGARFVEEINLVNEVERLRHLLKDGHLSHLLERGNGEGAERAAERFADELVQVAESRAARYNWGREAVAEELQATLASHANKWARIREARASGASESDVAAAVAEAFGRTTAAPTHGGVGGVGVDVEDLEDEAARRDELTSEGWVW